MKSKRIAVLRGGESSEYEVSMRTGASVISSLRRQGYSFKDIVITRAGTVLYHGIPSTLEKVLKDVDVVFIALHGEHGEDGRVQRFLTSHHIPYTGSGAIPSALALNKVVTKKIVADVSVNTPKYIELNKDNTTFADLKAKLTAIAPDSCYVVKPASSGSSVDTYVKIDCDDVPDIVMNLFKKYDTVLVEECIDGVECTVGVLEGMRGHDIYCMPVVEIRPTNQDFYSYEAKYSGGTNLICPARIKSELRDELHQSAVKVHKVLGLGHYSRSDFIIKDGQIYFLEVNTLPGLTEHSLLPRSLEAVGISYDELVSHLIARADY